MSLDGSEADGDAPATSTISQQVITQCKLDLESTTIMYRVAPAPEKGNMNLNEVGCAYFYGLQAAKEVDKWQVSCPCAVMCVQSAILCSTDMLCTLSLCHQRFPTKYGLTGDYCALY